jgi:hypothetical protein
MTHQQFSKKGGQSKSAKKRKAGQSNLAKARAALAKQRKNYSGKK